MPKTGNSGTVTLSVSGLTLSFVKIGEWQPTRGKLEVSHLGTTDFKEFVQDDLADPGEVELEALFLATAALADISEDPETITITYPKETPANHAAVLSGTGFLIAVSLPELVNGTITKQKVKAAFNGLTGPTFVAEHTP